MSNCARLLGQPSNVAVKRYLVVKLVTKREGAKNEGPYRTLMDKIKRLYLIGHIYKKKKA